MATMSAPPAPAVRVATLGKYCCTPSHMARPVEMVALSPVDGEIVHRSHEPVAPLLKTKVSLLTPDTRLPKPLKVIPPTFPVFAPVML